MLICACMWEEMQYVSIHTLSSLNQGSLGTNRLNIIWALWVFLPSHCFWNDSIYMHWAKEPSIRWSTDHGRQSVTLQGLCMDCIHAFHNSCTLFYEGMPWNKLLQALQQKQAMQDHWAIVFWTWNPQISGLKREENKRKKKTSFNRYCVNSIY